MDLSFHDGFNYDPGHSNFTGGSEMKYLYIDLMRDYIWPFYHKWIKHKGKFNWLTDHCLNPYMILTPRLLERQIKNTPDFQQVFDQYESGYGYNDAKADGFQEALSALHDLYTTSYPKRKIAKIKYENEKN